MTGSPLSLYVRRISLCEPGLVKSSDGVCKPCAPGSFEVERLVCLPSGSEYYVPLPGSTESDQVP